MEPAGFGLGRIRAAVIRGSGGEELVDRAHYMLACYEGLGGCGGHKPHRSPGEVDVEESCGEFVGWYPGSHPALGAEVVDAKGIGVGVASGWDG